MPHRLICEGQNPPVKNHLHLVFELNATSMPQAHFFEKPVHPELQVWDPHLQDVRSFPFGDGYHHWIEVGSLQDRLDQCIPGLRPILLELYNKGDVRRRMHNMVPYSGLTFFHVEVRGGIWSEPNWEVVDGILVPYEERRSNGRENLAWDLQPGQTLKDFIGRLYEHFPAEAAPTRADKEWVHQLIQQRILTDKPYRYDPDMSVEKVIVSNIHRTRMHGTPRLNLWYNRENELIDPTDLQPSRHPARRCHFSW